MIDPVSSKLRFARLLDLVPLTVVIAAGLYFVGWSYRQTYYELFALDPSSLGGTNIAIAVEGVNALVQMLWQWGIAAKWPLVATFAVLLVAAAVERVPALERKIRVTRASNSETKGAMGRASWIALAVIGLLFMGLSGPLAAQWRARDRVDNVRQGETWSYHLPHETIDGVTIAQAGDLTWVLTCSGMRALRTSDIQRVDGPLFQRVTHIGSVASKRGCAEPIRQPAATS